ncbi:MAG: hypothetical protein EOP11_21520, partial [Proteobacteria bacterium]
MSNFTKVLNFTLVALTAGGSLAQAQSLTIQGKVTDAAGQAVAGSAVVFRVQILAPDASGCVLFDESHTVDLSSSYGLFAVSLNDGTGTRQGPSTYTLEQALSNRAPYAVSATYCKAGSGTVNYTPAASDNRKVLIQFKDPATMSSYESIPEMDLNPVAFAMESRTVGGYPASSILRLADPTGTAPSFSPTQVTELQALLAGSSTSYMQSASGTTTGAHIPTVSGTPATPSAGSIWFDTSGSELRYFDGTTTKTIGTGTGSGTITNVIAGTGLLGGGSSGAVTLNLNTSGVSAGTYGSAGSMPVITVDSLGRVTSASTTA